MRKNYKGPSFSRRTLLKGLLAIPFVPGVGAGEEKGWLFVPRTNEDHSKNDLVVFDLQSRELRIFPLPETIHSLCQHPREKNVFFAFSQKGGKSIQRLVFEGKKIHLEKMEVGEKSFLYGHGTVSPDGQYLLTSEKEMVGEEGMGSLTIRNIRTLKIEDKINDKVLAPHDLKFLDGNHLVYTNSGIKDYFFKDKTFLNVNLQAAPSHLEIIDWKTRKKILTQAADPRYSIRHVHVTEQGKVAFIGILRGFEDGPPDPEFEEAIEKKPALHSFIGVLDLTGKVIQAQIPAEMFPEIRYHTLSVIASDKYRFLAVTSPFGNLLSFFHLADGKLLKKISLPGARGLAFSPSGDHLYCSSGNLQGGSLSILSCKTLEKVGAISSLQIKNLVWGSHMALYPYP